MQREFFVNILLLIAVNLLIKPFYIFGIDRTVQNVVGTEVYGMYFTLLSLTYLLQILGDFGIQNFNNREISQHNHLIDKYFSNILVLKSLLAAVYFAAVFVTAWLSGYGIEYFHLLFILTFNQFLVMLVLYLRSNLSGMALYRTDSLLSSLDKLLVIIFCGFLLWTPFFRDQFKIEWFAYAQTLSLLLTAAVAYFLVSKHLTKIRLHFRWPVLLFILKKSYPFALVVLLMTIYTRIDAVMIERMLPDGAYQAGLYGAAYRLLDAANMIGFLFASLLLPMFSRMLKKGEDTGLLVNSGFHMIWAGAVALAVAVFFYRDEIMTGLYLHAEAGWGDVLGWLMFTFIAVGGTYIYGTLLTAGGSLMKMNGIFVISILLNVLLNAWFIPMWKAEGAAIATLVTQWFAFIAQVWLAGRLLGARIKFENAIRALVYGGGCFGIGYLLSQVSGLPWIPAFVVCLAGSLILGFIIKLLNFQALLAIISGK